MLCRGTCCIRVKCSSQTTGSVSTPKSLAETQRSDGVSSYCSDLQGGLKIKTNNNKSPPVQISIPVISVTFIKKTKTALLVPNALVIETTGDQVRGSVTPTFLPQFIKTEK